eukprot:TRINITY_DN3009_c0_g1_i1.p1 TRINITY_DN3009_c0_g1~~TRINITY_DN3009_c0_g1_i1.p1  ORF type:complete len:549 (-),score=112.96 TRINITY_DN3009_c0_g1_i1:188-1834(-)
MTRRARKRRADTARRQLRRGTTVVSATRGAAVSPRQPPSCLLVDLPDDCLRLVCIAAGKVRFPHPLFRVCRLLRSSSFDAVAKVSLFEGGAACINSANDVTPNAHIASIKYAGRFLLGCRNLRTLTLRSLHGIEDEFPLRKTMPFIFGAALGQCLPHLPLHTLYVDDTALVNISARSVSATPLRELHLELEGEHGEQEKRMAAVTESLKAHAVTLRVLEVNMALSAYQTRFGAAVRQAASLPCLRRLDLSGLMSAQLMIALCVACPAVTTLDLTGTFRRGAMSALALPALSALSDVQIPFTGQLDMTHHEWVSELASMLHGRALDHLFLLSTAEDEDEEDPAAIIAAVSQSTQLPQTFRYYTSEAGDDGSCAGLDDECLWQLAAAPGAGTALRSLSIELFENVSVNGLEVLGKLPSLQRLHLRAPFINKDALQPWVITQVSELKVTCDDVPSILDLVTALGEAAPALTALTHLKLHTSNLLPPSAAAGLGALSLQAFDFVWLPIISGGMTTSRVDPAVSAAAKEMKAWAARLWRGNVATVHCPMFLEL